MKAAHPPGHQSVWPHWHQERMHVGGYDLEQVAAMAGQTPFYVYDRELISERVQSLKSQLPSPLKLHYAIKANPHPAVVCHLATLVEGLDVASLKELQLALATGLPREQISFAGPGKTPAEIDAAVAAGIVIIAESTRQIQLAARAGDRLGITPRLALRVNPVFELKASGMKMTGGSKPFGIDSEQIAEAAQTARELGLNVEGLHLFCGSQNLNATAIIEAHSQAIQHAIGISETLQLELRFVNIGGGLGIPYFPGDKPLQLAAISDNLATQMDALRGALPYTEVVMELGRYLVGEAGLYVSRVIETKSSRGTRYIIVDGGLHHHLANSGNFGQVLRKNFPIEVQTKTPRQEKQKVTIVGPLCTPLDIVADAIELDRLEPGDLIAVRQSGAYGASASPQHFLSHPPVVELLL